MANFFADIQTTINGPASGQPLFTRMKANKLNGRVRHFESLFVAPASGVAPAIADKIFWGKLPVRSRIINHLSRLTWNTGTAACTINLGDNVSAARYLAATAINATSNAVPLVNELINAGTGNVTINSNVITGLTSIGAFQAGANITGVLPVRYGSATFFPAQLRGQAQRQPAAWRAILRPAPPYSGSRPGRMSNPSQRRGSP